MAVRTEGFFLDEGQQGRGPNGTLQKPNQGVEHPSAVILIIHFAEIVSNVNSHTSAERLLYDRTSSTRYFFLKLNEL